MIILSTLAWNRQNYLTDGDYVVCMPPQEEPSKTANGSYPQTHTYDVVVCEI